MTGAPRGVHRGPRVGERNPGLGRPDRLGADRRGPILSATVFRRSLQRSVNGIVSGSYFALGAIGLTLVYGS